MHKKIRKIIQIKKKKKKSDSEQIITAQWYAFIIMIKY